MDEGSTSTSTPLSHFLIDSDITDLEKPFLGEICTEQREILERARPIEQLIVEWRKSASHSTCFFLLQTLFKLFKSEVSLNLSLRGGISQLRSDVVTSKQVCEDLADVISAGMKFDPALSDLSDILKFASDNTGIFTDSDHAARTLTDARRSLETLSQEFNSRKRELSKVKCECKKKKISVIRNFYEVPH
jgi:hypothetical protein